MRVSLKNAYQIYIIGITITDLTLLLFNFRQAFYEKNCIFCIGWNRNYR